MSFLQKKLPGTHYKPHSREECNYFSFGVCNKCGATGLPLGPEGGTGTIGKRTSRILHETPTSLCIEVFPEDKANDEINNAMARLEEYAKDKAFRISLEVIT